MRLQLLSDLHLEFHRDGGRSFFSSLGGPADDDIVLVLAGDIEPAITSKTFAAFMERWRRVIYVPGNHEYYGRSGPEEHARLTSYRALEKSFNLTVLLEGQTVTVDGQRFIGGTMWFSQQPGTQEYYRVLVSDFSQIREFTPWVYGRNDAFMAALRESLCASDVVVTHHMPSMMSTPPRYRRSDANRFFVHDCTDLITERKPKLWLHGHTHEACDYRIGETRVVCNPYGYPSEAGSTGYQSGLIIEV